MLAVTSRIYSVRKGEHRFQSLLGLFDVGRVTSTFDGNFLGGATAGIVVVEHVLVCITIGCGGSPSSATPGGDRICPGNRPPNRFVGDNLVLEAVYRSLRTCARAIRSPCCGRRSRSGSAIQKRAHIVCEVHEVSGDVDRPVPTCQTPGSPGEGMYSAGSSAINSA